MRGSAAASRAWGWHPLTDDWAARIVADAAICPGDLVLDIGAGRGALTAHLVKAGARVLAIELHPGRVEHLRRRFDGDDVSVIQADAATSLRLPHKPFRVVSNPPYAISSALLRVLTARGSRLTSADLVLQRAFVRSATQRWSSRRWDVAAGRALPRRAFTPPPRVDSAVLLIRRPSGA